MVPRKSTYRGTYRYNTSTTTGCNGNYRSSQSQNNNYHHRYDLLLHLLRMIAQEPILMVLLCIWNVIAILGIVVLSQRLQNAANEFLVLGATNTTTTMMNGSTTTTTAANAVAVVVVPDVRYLGYTHEQLYTEFYNRIGTHGCSIYSTLALWDIVVLVPAYILLLGTFYVHVTRYTYDKVITTSTTSMSIWNTNNHNNIHNDPYERGYWNADRRVSYLLLPIAILDWIETFIQRRGCTLLLLQQQLPQLQLSHLQVRIASMSVSMKWSMLLFFAITIMERLYRVVSTIQTSKKQHPSNHHRLLPLWM